MGVHFVLFRGASGRGGAKIKNFLKKSKPFYIGKQGLLTILNLLSHVETISLA